MPDDHAFPEDWGTGTQTTVDWNDAGSFAQLADHEHSRQYVESGFHFTPDFSNGVLQISAGKAFLGSQSAFTNDHTEDGGPPQKELIGATHVAQKGVSGDLTMVSGEVNYAYLHIDTQDNDGVRYVTNTTTEPSGPSITLGYVDMANEQSRELNRFPAMTARRLRIAGRTHATDHTG